MNRREFTGTVLTYGLLQMLWARDLFAGDVKPVVGQWFKDLNAIGQHCSETERRADDATRDVEAWLKTYYMQDHVGSEYVGTISGVTHFGLFVTLDELYVDGLVHISDLGQDYFQFDAAKHLLRGERSGARYQLGQRVNVKVVRVNLEQSKIDFVLVNPPEAWLAEKQDGKDRSPKLRDYDKKMKKLEQQKPKKGKHAR